jgi:Fungal chitosanase of glycosyl hydrolase group 75
MFPQNFISPRALTVTFLLATAPAQATGDSCGFVKVFDQPNEDGAQTVHVYRSGPSASIGGDRPIAFVVPDVKVNTDGTRISYAADDPRAKTRAINDIRNAYNNPTRPISDFEAVRDAGWKPTTRVWSVLSSQIIERDARPGREGQPCLDNRDYLVSMTAIRAKNSGVQGDCDQSKWVDALAVPAFVVPGNSLFQQRGVSLGDIVVGLTLHQPRQTALGIVGDIGPAKKIGEASVEMNRILDGLPPGSIPTNQADAEKRFQGPKTLFLILPGASNRVSQPIDAASVRSFAESRFNAWGGQARLEGCMSEIPEAR